MSDTWEIGYSGGVRKIEGNENFCWRRSLACFFFTGHVEGRQDLTVQKLSIVKGK